MHVSSVILWLVPSLCLAYTPPAQEILSRMELTMRRSDPVVLQVVRESPDGTFQHKYNVRIPAGSSEDTAADPDLPFPYTVWTLPGTEILNVLGSLADGNASVRLDRFADSICYLLEGREERLWLRKSDLMPLRIDALSSKGDWMTYLYLNPVKVSGKTLYPSKTEVQRNGSLVLVERLLTAPAGSDKP